MLSTVKVLCLHEEISPLYFFEHDDFFECFFSLKDIGDAIEHDPYFILHNNDDYRYPKNDLVILVEKIRLDEVRKLQANTLKKLSQSIKEHTGLFISEELREALGIKDTHGTIVVDV